MSENRQLRPGNHIAWRIGEICPPGVIRRPRRTPVLIFDFVTQTALKAEAGEAGFFFVADGLYINENRFPPFF